MFVSPWWLLGCLLVATYAFVLAWNFRPAIFIDDAAISFRFAVRLAAGHGFTYNDHERVLGASNPLYVLLLAALSRTGLDIEIAARGLALLLFPASVVVAAVITSRLSTRLAGLFGGVLLASQEFFRLEMLGGMESALAVLLGLLVVLALLDGRDRCAAVLLGLAVWNKLDAGTLALGVAAAWLVVRRTFPTRIAAVSLLVVLPWLAFATWYFGSPIPNSLAAKFAGNTAQMPDRLWASRFVAGAFRPFLGLALALFLPQVWRSLTRFERTGVVTIAAWFAFHWLALSVVWLGDYYPWYLTVLCPPPIILGVAGASRLIQQSARFSRAWRIPVAGGVGLLLVAGSVQAARTLPGLLLRSGPHPIRQMEAFDFDRRLAGRFLARYAEPSEVVGSGFGWVAYEIPNPFNDYSSLCTRQRLDSEAYYVVPTGVPYNTGSQPPRGHEGSLPLATFNLSSDLYPGWRWFTVFGSPDSAAAKSGKRFLQLRLFELSAPEPYSDDFGLGDVRIVGTDLLAPPPSGATFKVRNDHQPVHLVFTPAFNPNVPVGKSDGATFEVKLGDELVHHSDLLPSQVSEPVVLALPGATQTEELAVSFITTPGPRKNRDFDWVLWRGVKAVVGDAYIDLPAAGNEELVRQWARYNPMPDRH